MEIEAGEYEQYVASMPERHQAALMSGDTVSTAYFEARRAGWKPEALVGDGQAVLYAPKGTVGLVVHRLRGLAQARPPEAKTRQQLRPASTYVSRVRHYLRPSFVRERRDLLATIMASPGMSAQDAEDNMRALIADQHKRIEEEA